jgi:hypothetical protein
MLMTAVVLAGFMFAPGAPAAEGIVVKVLATNPSETEEREVEVKGMLPRGIEPGNVIDSGGLDILLDEEGGRYCARKKVKLKPKESIAFEVEIENIWDVDQKKIDVYRRHTDQLVNKLSGTEYGEAAKKIKADFDARLQSLAEKNSKAGDEENVEAYISARREILEATGSIRDYMGMLENLTVRGGMDPGELLGRKISGNRAEEFDRMIADRPVDVQTNWKIVGAVLAILGLISVGFFVIWSHQLKKLRTVAEIEQDGAEQP